jgi:hypothetical protein
MLFAMLEYCGCFSIHSVRKFSAFDCADQM